MIGCIWLPANRHNTQRWSGPRGALNYADLLQTVQDLAEQLRQQGLQPGDRIAIAATRSPETIIRILAAVEAELAYVPLDQGYPAERIQSMLEQAQVRLTLGSPQTSNAPTARSELFASEPDLAYVLFTSGSTGPRGWPWGRPLAEPDQLAREPPAPGPTVHNLVVRTAVFRRALSGNFLHRGLPRHDGADPEAHRRDRICCTRLWFTTR